MKILVLEDDPSRITVFKRSFVGHDVDFAETAAGAIGFLSSFRYDIIFLDHDLGGEKWVSSSHKNTGSEVVRWLVGWYNGEKNERGRYLYPYSPASWPHTIFIIHSMNSVAAPLMAKNLRACRCSAKEVPFSTLIDKLEDFAKL